MNQYQTDAVVLATRDLGEADKFVTLFSREMGKINAVAHGVRRTRNRMSGTIQVFTYIDVALTTGKNLDSIRQCQVRQSFRQLREDLTRMAYGLFLAELVTELCPERQAEPQVFELLLNIITLLTTRNPRLVVLVGAWQVLSLLGYRPECSVCVVCGREVCVPMAFSVVAGGMVCQECSHLGGEKLGDGTGELLRRILVMDLHEPGNFTVTGAAMMETEKILINYLLHHLDKPLKSLEFIRQMSASKI